jgi:hypothetical protein
MTIHPFAVPEAPTANPLRYPEPFNAEYGAIRPEVLDYIDQNTDQAELAGGSVGQRFEW